MEFSYSWSDLWVRLLDETDPWLLYYPCKNNITATNYSKFCFFTHFHQIMTFRDLTIDFTWGSCTPKLRIIFSTQNAPIPPQSVLPLPTLLVFLFPNYLHYLHLGPHMSLISQMCWHTLVISKLKRLRQEDSKFKVILDYITRPV
jgi:hypothetical protein